MKKTLIVLAASIAAFAAVAPQPVIAAKWLVEPCIKSKLCLGLIEHWDFDETVSDSNRHGAFTSQLREPDGANVSADGTNKVTGTAAVSLSGSNYLWTNKADWPTTIAFWFRCTTLPANGSWSWLVGKYNTYNKGPSIYLYNNAGTVNVIYLVYSTDNHTNVQLTNTQAISVNTWYYVVAGFGTIRDATGVPIGGGLYSSVTPKSAGSPTASQWSSSIGFRINSGIPQIRIGAQFDDAGGKVSPDAAGEYFFTGQIDSLDFASREWQEQDIVYAFNGNAGLVYPYVTE